MRSSLALTCRSIRSNMLLKAPGEGRETKMAYEPQDLEAEIVHVNKFPDKHITTGVSRCVEEELVVVSALHVNDHHAARLPTKLVRSDLELSLSNINF